MNTQDVKERTCEYLSYAFNLTEHEQEIRDSLELWLPKRIIDFHSHIGNLDTVNEVPDHILRTMKSTFVYADASIHQAIGRVFFPDISIEQVAFAFPYPGIDLTKANCYIANLSNLDKSFIPFCTGRVDDLKSFFSDWHSHQFRGIKMYPLGENVEEMIADVFPPQVLRLASHHRLPVVMHLPKPLTHSVDEFARIASKYPEASLILAHMGLTKMFSSEVLSVFKKLANLPNVFLDTSMVTSKDVIMAAMENIGPKRVIFATDQPFNLLRVRPVIHPELGLRYATDFPYHWTDKEEQSFYANNGYCQDLVQSGLGVLLAIRSAIEESFSDSAEIKKLVFVENAKKVIDRRIE